jgi:hypothetical protein
MGGKSSPAPDYKPMMQASREAAQIMGGIGREQLAFSRQQYSDLAPTLKAIAASQQQAQEQQMQQAQDYYDYMQSTYRPIERKVAQQAQEFNTEEYRNQLAAKAAADAGRAFTQTQEASNRAMAGMGVNPNSGRFASMQNQNNLGLAAMKASAMTGTRQQAQQMGYARMLDAAGLGKGLAGASAGAYGGAVGAGNAAGAMYMAPGNQRMAGLSAGAGIMGQGFNTQMQGLNSMLGTQGSMYSAGLNAQGEMGGALVGAAGTIGAGYLGYLGAAAAI